MTNIYPVEEASSSFLDKIIDTIETCLVVSRLQSVEKNEVSEQVCYKAKSVKFSEAYGRRPSSSGSHMSVISVDPIAVL